MILIARGQCSTRQPGNGYLTSCLGDILIGVLMAHDENQQTLVFSKHDFVGLEMVVRREIQYDSEHDLMRLSEIS